MRHNMRKAIAIAALLPVLTTGSLPAMAACTKLGFSVNDYGKEGPTNDAKQLLDKYIAKWAADRGIASYKTGTKNVTCELFLDVILFDEHTCKAEATVCWDGSTPAGGSVTEAKASGEAQPAKPKTTTGSIEKPAPKSAEVTAAKAAPAEAAADKAPAEAATDAKVAPVAETPAP